MADIVLTIDPDDTSFSLHDRANGRRLMGFEAPVPETDSQWAFSADTEGERRANLRYRNRVITADVLLDRSTAALLEALENTLGQKVGKLAREGGELRFAYPTGTTITFNVLEASMVRTFDIADMAKFRARYEITFICEPFGLGVEEDLGDNTETTLPCLIFTEATVDGDVPALGRLVVDDDSGVNQWWLTWGLQSRYYSSSANAALFYEAEGRTILTGISSADAAASGGNKAVITPLTTSYKAVISTQATGGGAHLSHVGTFRVYARVQTITGNTGVLSVAMEWSEADFLRYTLNAGTTIPAEQEGTWRLIDLGLVSLSPVTSGTQRWEGRILAKSTSAGDAIWIDYLFLVPASEGSGIVSGVTRLPAPTSFVAEDSFTSTTAGNALNGRVAPTGGTWATSGAATDITFADTNTPFNEYLSRSATGTRYGILGTTNYTNIAVRALVAKESGLIARWTDANNHLKTRWQNVGAVYEIVKVVGGTETVLATSVAVHATPAYSVFTLAAFADGTVMLIVSNYDTGAVIETLTANDSVFATGGTLASGEPGVIHENDNSVTMAVDEFCAWVPPVDAAVFASQSLEVRSDRVQREDSGGAMFAKPSSYFGDYLYVPPSGAEGRTTRVIVKGTRADPTASDLAFDDISARLFVTPRYLVVPQA